MYNDLLQKKNKIAVIGLGYVGLPIALEFAKKFSVVGFDLDKERLEMMKMRVDPNGELPSSAFEDCDIEFTSDANFLKEVSFYIVSVPTPIDEHNLPDLSLLLRATETIGRVLKKGDYIVYESTVYPGCTEEDCIPVLEKLSGLKYKTDFKAGYSPERINPGDKEHTLTKVVKVVSGCDGESLENIVKVYETIIKGGIHKTSSIKVAEAAKIIENTQRDVNISLMNELSIIFNKMGVNTYEVLEAAGTKWNFLRFYPGLVGGHCIGVDPYYLTYKAQELGYHAKVINSGRYVNDSMGFYLAKQTVKKMIAAGKDIKLARVLVMGITFKENVNDIRNSKVIDIVNEFRSYGVHVEITDPRASYKEVKKHYGLELLKDIGNSYDAIVIAVNHSEYLSLDENYFKSISNNKALIVDVKGVYRGKINDLVYWSL